MNCLTSLFPHQIPAVEKLLPLRVGALFMEMGTGKTRAALELIARRMGRFDRVVWFCPVSLKATILQEIKRHTDLPEAMVYVFDGRTRANTLPLDRLMYVIGIETMSSSSRAVVAARKLVTEQSFVIVDESSYLKGNWAIRTRRIMALAEGCRYRLILTGTPLSQGVVDLFAQMRFLSPNILGYRSFYSFARQHLVYSDRIPGKIERVLGTEHLAKKIQPYTYQVTKEECLDLPKKLYETRWCELSPEQQNAYWEAKDLFAQDAKNETNFTKLSHYIFRLFTSLQEIACGFWNRRVDGQMVLSEIPNDRLALLLATIRESPEDAQIIIWSKYQYNTVQIGRAIENCAVIHGQMSPADRELEIARFRAGARCLVASPGVGGHGLTLNEANHVIFFSNGFKYSERLQAEDRCHRIGQDRPVTYIDITADCGIDKRIMKALSKKKNVVEEFRREVNEIKDKAAMVKLIEGL